MSFQNKTIYQIYPRSFRDSTGSGVGDLRGIIEKVPYIASLGVDMVWFNPFFVSPQRDNGYDIADYRAVNPALGTMEDFEELVAALDAHGIGVMLDGTFNHSAWDCQIGDMGVTMDLKNGLGVTVNPSNLISSVRPAWHRNCVRRPDQKTIEPGASPCP